MTGPGKRRTPRPTPCTGFSPPGPATGNDWRRACRRRGAHVKNERHLIYGQPVHAPCDGTVVSAADHIDDQEPGAIRYQPLYGDHVWIDTGAEMPWVRIPSPGSRAAVRRATDGSGRALRRRRAFVCPAGPALRVSPQLAVHMLGMGRSGPPAHRARATLLCRRPGPRRQVVGELRSPRGAGFSPVARRIPGGNRVGPQAGRAGRRVGRRPDLRRMHSAAGCGSVVPGSRHHPVPCRTVLRTEASCTFRRSPSAVTTTRTEH